MKTAEQIFYELNFYKIPNDELNEKELIAYWRKETTGIGNEYITFYKDKTVELTHISDFEIFKAINKQIEELSEVIE
jgi:hypothetical protein